MSVSKTPHPFGREIHQVRCKTIKVLDDARQVVIDGRTYGSLLVLLRALRCESRRFFRISNAELISAVLFGCDSGKLVGRKMTAARRAIGAVLIVNKRTPDRPYRRGRSFARLPGVFDTRGERGIVAVAERGGGRVRLLHYAPAFPPFYQTELTHFHR